MTEFTGEVHPYADTFPMYSEEDLKALADNIAAKGQKFPILLTPEGVLIDGRNRLAACELGGVAPKFAVTEDDPVELIMSANLQRRDLPKARKAFHAVASALFHNETTVRNLAAIAGVAPADIAKAQVVLRYTPETFQAVIEGRDDPTPAYKAAKDEKDRLELLEAHRAEVAANHPDLLNMGLSVEEAYAAYQERDRERLARERERQAALQRDANRLRNFMDGWYAAATLAETPDRDDILGALTDFDRDRYLRMEKNTTWQSTTI